MNNLQKIFLLFLVAAALPFFAVCFYALPFADDFCFAWTASEKISFAQKFLNQYLFWNGRYTADVLVNFHPLRSGKVFFYQLTLFLSLLFTPLLLFFLMKRFLQHNIQAALASLIIFLLYLQLLPNLSEGVYWFIGIANYHVGNLCLTAHFVFAFRKSKMHRLTAVVFLLAAVGVNEIAAVIIPVFYGAAYFVSKRKFKTHAPEIRNYFFVSCVGAALVICSPGNFSRADLFAQNHQLFHSLYRSTLQTVRFTISWLISMPVIFGSLILIAVADETEIGVLSKIDFRVSAVFALFLVFVAAFLPYFATGILGQHRTMNYVLFFFLLLWLPVVFNATRFFLKGKLINFFDKQVIGGLGIAGFMFSFFVAGNSSKIYDDFFHGSFKKYETEFFERQKEIIMNPSASIRVMEHVPSSFSITDVKNDTTFFADKCLQKFYSETGVELK